MNRFFGMMPSSEVSIEKHFDDDGLTIIVQAGAKGWSVIYGDGSSQFKDVEDTAENNYEKALAIMRQDFPDIQAAQPSVKVMGEERAEGGIDPDAHTDIDPYGR